jgi:hypothetical protein
MIALAGNLTGDNTLMAIALVAQLVALAGRRRRTAPGPAACRPGSSCLHCGYPPAGGLRQSPHKPTRSDHAQSQRSTRARNAAEHARRDFPAGLRPTQSAAGAVLPDSPQPERISSQRAGPRHTGRYRL